MLRLVRELQQGKEPVAAANGTLYDVRPATVVLPVGQPVGGEYFRTREQREAAAAE
jgi:hypothetical protein